MITYSSAIHACGADWERAISLLQQMRDEEIQINLSHRPVGKLLRAQCEVWQYGVWLVFLSENTPILMVYHECIGSSPRQTQVELLSYKLSPIKKCKMGVSGRVCLYVACYDFMLGFNVSSSVLMIFQVGFWGSFWC